GALDGVAEQAHLLPVGGPEDEAHGFLGASGRNALARAVRRVQLQGGARGPHARRTLCTFRSEGGFAPLPKPPPRIRCAGKAGARKRNTSTSGGKRRIGVHTTQR